MIAADDSRVVGNRRVPGPITDRNSSPHPHHTRGAFVM